MTKCGLFQFSDDQKDFLRESIETRSRGVVGPGEIPNTKLGKYVTSAYFISIMPISSPNPMFDYLLESSPRDDSNKWSNIGFGEEIMQIESIEGSFYAHYLELSLFEPIECWVIF